MLKISVIHIAFLETNMVPYWYYQFVKVIFGIHVSEIIQTQLKKPHEETLHGF